MTPAERVMAALSGQPVDRRPFAPLLGLVGAALTGCPLRRYFSDAEAFVAGQAAVIERFDPDVVFAPFALSLFGAAFGGSLTVLDDQAPNLTVPGLHRPDDLRPQTLPSIESEPHLRYLRDSLRGLVARCDGERPVAALALGPVDLPIVLFGLERWMELFLFDEEAADAVLAMCSTFCRDWYQALFADGASCVVLSSAFLLPEILTADLVRERARPWIDRTLSGVDGPVIIHHGGGRLEPHAPAYLPLPAAVVGLVPDERDDPRVLRDWFGPQPALLCGLNATSLISMDATAAAKALSAVMERVADDPAVLIVTAGPDLPMQIDPAIIDAMRAVVARGC